MRKIILLCVLVATIFLPVGVLSAEEAVQKNEQTEAAVKERSDFNKLKRSSPQIYKVTMRSNVVLKLQTALGYFSTIDLPEKALKVFLGEPELFKVEVYEKQVVVKPLTDELTARTNLLIITDSGRIAFDISVGPPESADYVLDLRLPVDESLLVQNAFDKKVDEKAKELEKKLEGELGKLERKAETLSEEKLKAQIASAAKTIELKKSKSKGNIQVNLLSLSRVGNKAYLRFSVLNYSDTPYRPLKVLVGVVQEKRNFLKKRQSGFVEFPAELLLANPIPQDSYQYGVLSFDYRPLGKGEKPVFRLMEDSEGSSLPQARTITIEGYRWLE